MEKVFEREVLRQFGEYWIGLRVLPIKMLEDCAGQSPRLEILERFSQNDSIKEIELLSECVGKAQFLLLLNIEKQSEKRSQRSREEHSGIEGESRTIWEDEARIRLELRAAIYDLLSGALLWEATAEASSSNTESSHTRSGYTIPHPEVTRPFGAALFQLQHRLTHDLGGPRIPKWVVEKD